MFSGCAKEKVSNDIGNRKKISSINNKENSEKSEEGNNLQDISDKDKDKDKETPDIQTRLEQDENVSEIIWSNDKLRVAYLKEIGDFQKELYMWDTTEEKEVKVEGLEGNLYDITWSPDDIWVTVNNGTSNLYETLIINPFNLMIQYTIVNSAGPVWCEDSNKIAFAVPNNKEAIVPTELSGTTDLIVFYLDTMTQYTVLEGESDFSYAPLDWNNDELKYGKYYLDDRVDEELIYDDFSYNIVQLIHTDENKNTEVIINYPMVQNLGDEETEILVNSFISYKAGVLDELSEYDDENYKETLYVDYIITKKSNEVLSMYFRHSLMMEGAAYPSTYIEGLTLNMSYAGMLELKDLFKEDADYKSDLNSILNEKVKELEFEVFEEFKGIEEEQGFYLTDSSLVIYYQEGIYTPHAIGPLFIEIPIEEIEDILK